MPAAPKAVESRRSRCFFTMSSSNQWTRASAAEAQASSSSRRRPEFPGSQYDDEERRNSPPGGYAAREIEEILPEQQRNPSTLPKENHIAFCAWFQSREGLRKKRARTNHCILGPNNMSVFNRHQMAIDSISWILYWGSEHREFDVALKWLTS